MHWLFIVIGIYYFALAIVGDVIMKQFPYASTEKFIMILIVTPFLVFIGIFIFLTYR